MKKIVLTLAAVALGFTMNAKSFSGIFNNNTASIMSLSSGKYSLVVFDDNGNTIQDVVVDKIPSAFKITATHIESQESRIISSLKKQGYRITDVERAGGATAYMLEKQTSYSFCAVVVTFYNGELQGDIVKQCL